MQLVPQRRQQRVESVLENGVVVGGGLQRLDERPIGPGIGPQRGIFLVVLGAADRRELHDRRRNDVDLDRSQDECRVGSGDAQFGQLRRQRLLDRQEQLRRSVALVCDGEKVLLARSAPCVASGQVTQCDRRDRHRRRGRCAIWLEQSLDEAVEEFVPAPDVPVDRGDRDAELIGETAHGECVHAVELDQPRRGVEDRARRSIAVASCWRQRSHPRSCAPTRAGPDSARGCGAC